MNERKDYTWLVKNREKIQLFNLQLYEYLCEKEKGKVFERDEIARSIATHLVGTAFSLWRAVFLTEGERDWNSILQHAQAFLEQMVKNNAINYKQDDDTRNWSVGYYLNNARYRLFRVQQKIIHLIGNEEAKNLKYLSKFSWSDTAQTNPDGVQSQEKWEEAFLAVEEALSTLKAYSLD